MRPQTPELQLLLACARAHPSAAAEKALLELLDEGPDWMQFAQKALNHDLAGLAGHTLIRVAFDRIPADIADAFHALIQKTRGNNRRLVDELFQLVDHLNEVGVEPICFKGPVLAMAAFGDLGLRGFRDLDILIRDQDLSRALDSFQAHGYERNGKLTAAQFDVIHRLQGQEIMFKTGAVAIEPHTRLTPLKMALSIDYNGLWRRAERQEVCGRALLTFAPEDTLLVLAIHGGKELWWDIKWACDVADFVASHPRLDWDAVLTRAKEQGCRRMLFVAATLAHDCLGAEIPDRIVSAAAADRTVGKIVARILARWEMEDPGGPPSNKTLSLDRFLLHDGAFRRASYVLRTWLLPGPQHVPLIALPAALNFAYVPIGIVHDLIALPLYRFYGRAVALAERTKDRLALSPLALALYPAPAEKKRKWRRLQQMHSKALETIAVRPNDCAPWIVLGDAFFGLDRKNRALASYDRALAIVPDQRSLWQKRGTVISALKKEGRHPDLKDFPEIDTKDANGWAIRAGFFSASGRHADAVEASEQALHLDPAHEAATRIGMNSRVYACDWTRREDDMRATREISGDTIVKPMTLKLLSDSEEDCLAVTSLWTRKSQWTGKPLWQGERYRHDKIRLAYLSTDFRSHPVGVTIVAPLEHHDKSRFEVTAISLHPSDNSSTRRRIEAAVDRFVDIQSMADSTVATMLRDMEIDIAVDLNGLTGSRRAGILLRRPAPLQVNYLGYPGTMAASHIDYIIADSTVIPDRNRGFYTEKIAYLPNTYLPYDRQRQIAATAPTRAGAGLPETGFVFASFNGLHKISPEMFDIWMRLLRATADSVLWLSGSDPKVIANLRREAVSRGVAPERIIFARYAERTEDHLARQRLADLFLDTFPYNAHTTASDALWLGLPVLTYQGEAFQARVAASLLRAAGLPELITMSLADYEKRALELAGDPTQLAAIRQKLARNRDSTPLFDTAKFTRDLESVYIGMWERQQAGLPPADFSIDP